MSTLLSERNGVRARKQKRCCLCDGLILVGELKDVRVGVESGEVWSMHMHPECHAYEKHPGSVDPDWYEDISDPAFERADALAFIAKS